MLVVVQFNSSSPPAHSGVPSHTHCSKMQVGGDSLVHWNCPFSSQAAFQSPLHDDTTRQWVKLGQPTSSSPPGQSGKLSHFHQGEMQKGFVPLHSSSPSGQSSSLDYHAKLLTSNSRTMGAVGLIKAIGAIYFPVAKPHSRDALSMGPVAFELRRRAGQRKLWNTLCLPSEGTE